MTVEHDIASIRALVYRMAERYGAKDVAGVMEGFVEDNPTVIGTGLDELRFGRAEVQNQIARDISEADALSMGIDNLRVDVFSDAAFAFSESNIHAIFGEQSHTFPVRATYGLVRTDEGWRIAQNHISVARSGGDGDGRSFSVKLTKTLSDLLTSIDNSTDSSILRSEGLETATLLFTDIVDSTSVSQSLGDERWSDLISEHFESVATIVTEEGGSVVKTLGDGGMYAFPSGTGALSAAMRIQQHMNSSPTLRLRIGAHTGDVIQGGADYIGLTVNKAARVAAAAEGGQILVSSTTADVVNHTDLKLGEPTTLELKGLAGTHGVQSLQWEKT